MKDFLGGFALNVFVIICAFYVYEILGLIVLLISLCLWLWILSVFLLVGFDKCSKAVSTKITKLKGLTKQDLLNEGKLFCSFLKGAGLFLIKVTGITLIIGLIIVVTGYITTI